MTVLFLLLELTQVILIAGILYFVAKPYLNDVWK